MAATFRMSGSRRFFNGIMMALLRRGIIPGPNMYLLTVAGRKSGKLITLPVQLVVQDQQKWLVAPYGIVQWVRNVRAAGSVQIGRGKENQTFRTEELSPEEAAPILKQFLQGLPKQSPINPFFDATASSPIADFMVEADRHPVFRLQAV